MMLPIHITIALSSVIFTAFMYFAPTQRKLRISYLLVGGTIASGTWLIVSNPSHMVEACMTGLTYLGIMFFGIILTWRKLQNNRD